MSDVRTWSRARRFGFLALVGLLVAGGPLGTDMYVPAMPQVSADLSAAMGLAQLTLPAYNIGLGAGQFFWGPVSDRFGRRGPLLIGVAAFIVGCLLCAVAPSIWVLLASRVVMGFAGSAGIVIGRSIVRDLYQGPELTRTFAMLTIVFGVSPVVAPLIGGGLLLITDWRGTFVVIAAIGAALLVATALSIPETLREANRVHGRSADRGEAWVVPLRNPVFVTSVLVLVGAASSMILYLSSVSVVLQDERGLSPTVVGVIYAITAIGVIAGGQAVPLLAGRLGGLRSLAAALALDLVAGVGVALVSVADGPIWLLVVAMWFTVFATGICFPLAMAMALEPFARGAGTAAAIAGGCQLALGSIIPAIVANVFPASGLVLGLGQAGAAVMTLAFVAAGAAVAGRRRRLDLGDAEPDFTEPA